MAGGTSETAGGRPKTLEEAKQFLRDRLATRRSPMNEVDEAEAAAAIERLESLDQGVLDRPSTPLLLVNGKEDRQVPIEDLYLVLEHGDPKHARIFPGGHMGHTPETLTTIMKWLRARLPHA